MGAAGFSQHHRPRSISIAQGTAYRTSPTRMSPIEGRSAEAGSTACLLGSPIGVLLVVRVWDHDRCTVPVCGDDEVAAGFEPTGGGGFGDRVQGADRDG